MADERKRQAEEAELHGLAAAAYGEAGRAHERFEALAQRSRELPWWPLVESAPDVDPFSAPKAALSAPPSDSRRT